MPRSHRSTPAEYPAEGFLTHTLTDGSLKPSALHRQQQLNLEVQRLLANSNTCLGNANW
ncbi:hypothetical protein [Hymenobacter metallicola]|uniref:hypothetical protein n=1 Tax=Hymenobacter metallicola TaxID=2563114 RepID=UPI001436A85D|nr:hypothetical protein [Hymenobacter metallicola]